MEQINYLAVLAAALSMFVVGWGWYSVVFGRAWMAANGFTEDDLKRGNPAVIFGLALVFCLLMALNLAMFIGAPEIGIGMAVAYALAAGLGWAALGLGVVALFERRPPAYFLINGGYLTVGFVVMGLILGAWR